MKLDNKELFEFLNEKEVPYLYHANTVATSISFINQNGLLSRGGIEAKKITQTTQSSDEIDNLVNGILNNRIKLLLLQAETLNIKKNVLHHQEKHDAKTTRDLGHSDYSRRKNWHWIFISAFASIMYS